MPKDEQKVSYTAETQVETYKDSENQITENTQKKIEELTKGDHISTKRPQ